jgi:hypothetical protein
MVMATLYAQSSGQQQQFLNPPTPIAGLSLKLPEGVAQLAIVILNVPSPYSIIFGGDNTGGWFGISVDGKTLPVFASYSYKSLMPSNNPGRVPTTLVVGVPLTLKPQTIVALAGNCIIDSPATLSAIVA